MAPKKKKNKDRGRHSKTPGQTSASDPNPTEASPSASSPTVDAATTSLVPSSSSPPAPLTTSTTTTTTTNTTTQPIPSSPPKPISLLPSSPSQITIARPLRSAPSLPIKKRISCTSDGATTTNLPVPSIAPFASTASRKTPTHLPITDEFTSVFAPAVAGAMAAMQCVKEEDPAGLQKILGSLFGLQVDQMELVLECLQGMAENMKGDAELKAILESLADKK